MKDEFSHIFESGEHIDESRLWLYAQGELTPEEAHEIEKHLLECQMCSDVVEGFSLYDSEGSFNASMNRTSEAFFSKSRGNRKILIRSLSIAAVFVLLAGSTFMLVTQLNKTKISEPELAQEILPENLEKSEAESTENYLREDTSISSDIAMNLLEEPMKEEVPPEQEVYGNAGAVSDLKVVEELSVVSDDYDEDVIEIDFLSFEESEEEDNTILDWYSESDSEEVSGNDKTDVMPESVTETVAKVDVQNEADELSEVQIVTESTDSGFNLYRSRNSSSAQKSAEMLSPAETDDFTTGMNAYNSQLYSMAVDILSQIEREDESYWDARWIIADSYVKMNNIKKAIEQYHILQDTASPYKYSAGEKLQELGE